MRALPYLYALTVWLLLRSLFSVTIPHLHTANPVANVLSERILYLITYCVGGYCFFHIFARNFFANRTASTTFRRIVAFPEKPFRFVSLLIWLSTGASLYFAIFLLSALQNDGGASQSAELRTRLLKGDIESMALIITISCITPVLEEFFYRGLLQNFLSEKKGILPALLFQAALFGLAHPPSVFPVIALIGVVFGIVSMSYGSAASAISHAAYNSMILASELTLRS
jgi:membrane protease YdiL (CAAX protease family)